MTVAAAFVDGGLAPLSLFGLVWFLMMAAALGTWVIGLAALVDAARTPGERFGPWWDNTKQLWVLGLVLSFLLPLGPVVGGALWFAGGRGALRRTGIVGRPFWAGAPKPPPYWGPPPAGPTGPPPMATPRGG